MAVESPQRSAEDLRDMTRRWLAEHLPAGWMEAVDAGDTEAFATLRAGLDYAAWCVEFGEAGYATPTWPSEYGAGLSLSPGDARFVNEVLNRYKVPRPYNIIGIGMGGPTVMAWGTEEMKHRLLRPLACNQEIWCQLFSEPGAGSDVAGLATRAVRDGDEWVVNGQKVWTTVAHLSKWGMLLCRTNPDVPKHAGCRTSSSTWSSRASRCGRWCRSRVTPSSTRCSSTTRACATTGCSAGRATAGRSRSRRS